MPETEQPAEVSFDDYVASRTGKTLPDAEAPSEAEKPEPVTESEPVDTEESTEEDKPVKGKGGFQKRIDKLVKRNHSIEGENEELRARLQAIEDRLAAKPAATKDEAPAQSSDSRPKPEDFNGPDAWDHYQDALLDWKVAQKLKAKDEEASKKSESERQKKTFDTYNKAVSEARGKYEDFDEVVGSSTVQLYDGVRLAIVEYGDIGPEIVYYLAKNPDVAEQLTKMSQLRAIAEVGRIAKQFEPTEADSSPENKPVSASPAPIKPVGGASTRSSVPIGEMSFEDYAKARQGGRRR